MTDSYGIDVNPGFSGARLDAQSFETRAETPIPHTDMADHG